MPMIRRVGETPDDFTARINRSDVRPDGVWVINRTEVPIRQQKPVLRPIGLEVPSDDVSGRANSSRVSVGHARVVKGNEIRLCLTLRGQTKRQRQDRARHMHPPQNRVFRVHEFCLVAAGKGLPVGAFAAACKRHTRYVNNSGMSITSS